MDPKSWPWWKRVLWEALLLAIGAALAFPTVAVIIQEDRRKRLPR